MLRQIENRWDKANGQKLQHNPRNRSGDDVTHRDRDRGNHQKRLDDQERHQENQENERRRPGGQWPRQKRAEALPGANPEISRPIAAKPSQIEAMAKKTVASANKISRLAL